MPGEQTTMQKFWCCWACQILTPRLTPPAHSRQQVRGTCRTQTTVCNVFLLFPSWTCANSVLHSLSYFSFLPHFLTAYCSGKGYRLWSQASWVWIHYLTMESWVNYSISLCFGFLIYKMGCAFRTGPTRVYWNGKLQWLALLKVYSHLKTYR